MYMIAECTQVEFLSSFSNTCSGIKCRALVAVVVYVCRCITYNVHVVELCTCPSCRNLRSGKLTWTLRTWMITL